MRMITVSSLSLLSPSLRLKELVRGRARLDWMKLVLAAGVFALIAGAWTEKTASMGPTCSARNTRNEQIVGGRGSYVRYCGPSRAVLRVDGKVFRVKHGTCNLNEGVGFGLIAYGGSWPHGRGMWLRLQRAGTDELFWQVRAGRYSVIDGEVQLPGYGSLPHTGTAIVAKHGKSLRGTFSLGSPANPVTGRFTCG
jgi:hypothetical protein